ncbi:hypothetical protein AVEN_202088-1 [Araneus ventricosus]|uniref:Secreted protein n=1 Tax=Araneus ventricosus TaxID=182803 RepID=A0A4Y2QUD8_ARAVE|nr:hypothetical protein AVEN_202088-1 [Araneus ventricosus]
MSPFFILLACKHLFACALISLKVACISQLPFQVFQTHLHPSISGPFLQFLHICNKTPSALPFLPNNPPPRANYLNYVEPDGALTRPQCLSSTEPHVQLHGIRQSSNLGAREIVRP